MSDRNKFTQLIPPDLLQSLMDEHFDTRKNSNNYNALLLMNSNEFNNWVIKIRKKYNIPDLTFEEDGVVIQTTDEVISSWLERQDRGKKRKISSEIVLRLKKLKYSDNFNDWIKNYILYGNPSYLPLYNQGLITGHPEKIQEIGGTTTNEKKYILHKYKKTMNGKEYPASLKRKVIKVIKKLTSKNFNKRSRRNVDSSIKTLELGTIRKRDFIIQDAEEEKGEYKVKYEDLVGEIYEAVGDEGNIILKNQRLRKQRERLLKDIKKIDKIFKN